MSDSAKIIVQKMYENDAMSQWLGIKILKTEIGHCIIQMEVRDEMTNGFKIAHGGISYALADSAFAFASNAQGRHAVSIETSISHTKAIYPGDILTADCKEKNLSHKIGIYEVTVTNQSGDIVALFKGTVYRKSVEWDIE